MIVALDGRKCYKPYGMPSYYEDEVCHSWQQHYNRWRGIAELLAALLGGRDPRLVVLPIECSWNANQEVQVRAIYNGVAVWLPKSSNSIGLMGLLQ
jgi:hypothetical protein